MPRSPCFRIILIKEKDMLLSALTIFHVAVSIAGIGSGFIVVYGLLISQRFDGWTQLFLWTTVATSLTGFLFPVHEFMPSHILGILSLIVLLVAILARYRFHLAGAWRKTYAITAITALYLNVFVLIVQLFRKVPALKALAPTQSEPPFQITQLAVLVIFVVLGFRGVVGFGKVSRTA
jgi:hypothetical protein